MRGKLGYDKWYVYELVGLNSFEASRIVNGKQERWYGSAHCVQCAKTELLAEHGGRVDLRGWHLSHCGAFLKVMQAQIEEEEKAA